MSSSAVIVVSPDELARIVRDAVRAALEAHTPASDATVPIKRCGVPPTTRRRWTREGRLPTMKIGRELFVRRADLASCIISCNTQRDDGPADEFTRALRGRG